MIDPTSEPVIDEGGPMPVFTIKAKDAFAVPIISAYRDMCASHGLDDQAAQVDLAIGEMLRWREANHGQIKFPDHQHVPVDQL